MTNETAIESAYKLLHKSHDALSKENEQLKNLVGWLVGRTHFADTEIVTKAVALVCGDEFVWHDLANKFINEVLEKTNDT